MAIKQQTPPEAYETLKNTPGAIYLDVRTEGEFAAGHPTGAINVPVLFLSGGQRKMNIDFVEIVEKLFPPATALVVGCMSGGRSQHACELLEEAGYTTLTNVAGGFGGARDQSGRVIVAGWQDAGLPVSTDLGDAAYEAVKKKAGF